jgi:ribose 5-phosphate isomerase B
MLLSLGCDHRGFELKTLFLERLRHHMPYISVHDHGCFSLESADYTDVIPFITQDVLHKNALGILICHTGFGMCIGANRFRNIRAVLCRSELEAKWAKEHNHANILVIGASFTTLDMMWSLFQVFINSKHDHTARHLRRVTALDGF